MPRPFTLVALALTVAACSPSKQVAADDAQPIVAFDNQNLVAYDVFADGVRLGRVGPKTTRRFSVLGFTPGSFVTFSARQAGADLGVTWAPVSVQPGEPVLLTISYRPPR